MDRTGTSLCLGIDPDPDALPPGFRPDVDGVEAFARLVLEAALSHASAVKANLAFFEAWGSPGMAMLERLRAGVPADVPFIADAKRGDIRSTSVRHAAAIFDALDADAVTASPYVGGAALEPLLERSDRFVYVLCRTSDPGSGELQDLVVAAHDGAPEEPFHLRVARRASDWGAGRETIGLVVGATTPAQLGRVRGTAPDLPFLVPGVGAQGGDAAATLRDGPATGGAAGALPGGALLVNVSRGIAAAAREGGDVTGSVSRAAEEWAERLRFAPAGPV
jgi:orotidine-5'-phosphate decarboxylase